MFHSVGLKAGPTHMKNFEGSPLSIIVDQVPFYFSPHSPVLRHIEIKGEKKELWRQKRDTIDSLSKVVMSYKVTLNTELKIISTTSWHLAPLLTQLTPLAPLWLHWVGFILQSSREIRYPGLLRVVTPGPCLVTESSEDMVVERIHVEIEREGGGW